MREGWRMIGENYAHFRSPRIGTNGKEEIIGKPDQSGKDLSVGSRQVRSAVNRRRRDGLKLKRKA